MRSVLEVVVEHLRSNHTACVMPVDRHWLPEMSCHERVQDALRKDVLTPVAPLHQVKLRNGATIYCAKGTNPDRLRGVSITLAWADPKAAGAMVKACEGTLVEGGTLYVGQEKVYQRAEPYSPPAELPEFAQRELCVEAE